jgi:hypothetical protein
MYNKKSTLFCYPSHRIKLMGTLPCILKAMVNGYNLSVKQQHILLHNKLEG